MEPNEKEIAGSTTSTEETVNQISKEEFDKVVSERDGLKKDVETLAAQKEHWRKKAEPKETKPEEVLDTKKENSALTQYDLYALMEAKVPKEDVPEVERAAKVLGKSVSEVLSDPIIRSMLSDRAEKRATAAASITKNQRPVTKENDDTILEKASRGQIADDAKEIEKLAAARMASRTKR